MNSPALREARGILVNPLLSPQLRISELSLLAVRRPAFTVAGDHRANIFPEITFLDVKAY
ncbi:hypothetical protein SFRURICE_001937 [Spodoptera frugiperda]|nr:hypothetical protein SFRURICE_001937 [Spodoptera frugiperda]